MANEEHDPKNGEPTQEAPASASQTDGTPISLDDATIERLLDNETFQEGLSRRLQSEKDREINRLKKQLSEVEAVISKAAPVTDVPASTPPVTQSEISVSQALRDAGIDPNDALVNQALAFKREQRGSQADLTDYLLEQRAARNNQPPASPASATQTGGSVGSPTSAADVQAEIDAISADRAKMLSSEGRAELKALAAKLEKLENTA